MMILAAVTLIISGLAFVFSMLGLGGAMLYIPVLHWFGFDFKSVAIPTGLLLNAITALSAAIYYLRARMVDIKGSLPLIFASFVGAPLGAYFTKFFPTRILIVLFALAMAFAGGRMLLTSGHKDREQMLSYQLRLVLMGIGGFFIGFIAGLLGVGGGFLFVPMMLVIGYKTKQAAATSSFVVIFSSFSGFAGHVAEGHYDWPLMVVTTIGVIIGSQIGAKVMKEKMRDRWIKQVFAFLLLGVAVKLLWSLII
jgi:uncharacterized membrane protein YfcA